MGYCFNRRTPHPPLRPVRQYEPRRQYRATAQVAGLCAACAEGCKSLPRRASRDSLAALSLLRRAHDRHRIFRARDAAALSSALRRRDPVRYVMRCDPLLRWAIPFSTVGCHAAPLDLCLQCIIRPFSSAILPSVPVVRATTASIRPVGAKERIEAAKQRSHPLA